MLIVRLSLYLVRFSWTSWAASSLVMWPVGVAGVVGLFVGVWFRFLSSLSISMSSLSVNFVNT